jgi:uncharacterized oligopeptide transporter (OPT) family protein
MDLGPVLLGVGYIVGPRSGSVMAAGGVFSSMVLLPAIKFFGEGMTNILPPGLTPISEMHRFEIHTSYITYIGAGAILAGGIFSLARSLGPIVRSLMRGLQGLREGRGERARRPRTDQDIPMKFVAAGVIALLILIMVFSELDLSWSLLIAIPVVSLGFWFIVLSSRITGEVGTVSNPVSGLTAVALLLTCTIFLTVMSDVQPYYVAALSVGAILGIAISNSGTSSQVMKTGFLIGSTPKYQQLALLAGTLASVLVLGPVLLSLNQSATVYVPRVTFTPWGDHQLELPRARGLPPYTGQDAPPVPSDYRLLSVRDNFIEGLTPGEYLVDESGQVVYKVEQNFPAELRVDATALTKTAALKGPQAQDDTNTYCVWVNTNNQSAPLGRYLVDDGGVPRYFIDPGINGRFRQRPDGTMVQKYIAPRATLMAFIVKSILDLQFPMILVLLGVVIAVVLEMCGIPSLVFAVGLYLPLSASLPIFLGGIIRRLVDKRRLRKSGENLLAAESSRADVDKSPGVLMASGYIAGGAVAAIVISLFKILLTDADRDIEDWALSNNPFYGGPSSDELSLLPYALLVTLLLAVGTGRLLSSGAKRSE